MTALQLFETDGAAAAGDATTRLFATASRTERYRRNGWPYATSMLLHAMAMISIAILARNLTRPPHSTPSRQSRRIVHAFVFTGLRGGGNHRPHTVQKTLHSNDVPVAVADDATVTSLPPALGDSRAPDTSSLLDENPPQPAFDPPVPAGKSRLTSRRGDPTEAGLGSATPNPPGLPSGQIGSAGFGEATVRDVRNDGSRYKTGPGIDGPGQGDGVGVGQGGGAAPPRIQEPLPTPDYPAEARTRRLQGVVVLEVMLDARGQAHVRGVLSNPLGFGIEEAATNAAEKLKFIPARQGGRSVDAIVQVRVTFTLTGAVATTVTGGA